MKSPLDLEVVQKLSKTNHLFLKQKYLQSLIQCDSCLQTFYQNRSYSDTVNPYYESMILSTKGMILNILQHTEEAQNCFNKSLFLYPNNCMTLLRRAGLYLKNNRISEAIQDLGRSFLQFPQSDEIKRLKGIAMAKIEMINDKQQKQRLQSLLEHSQKSITEQSEELELKNLSFCNLRRIDRLSVKQQYRRKSQKQCSLFFEPQSKNLQDRNLVRQAVKINHKQSTHTSVLIIEKKKRKQSNCRSRSISQYSSDDQLSNELTNNYERSSTSNILQQNQQQCLNIQKRRSQVRFSGTQYAININKRVQQPQQVSRPKRKRKSCLRACKSTQMAVDAEPVAQVAQRESFVNLRKIDRQFGSIDINVEMNEKDGDSDSDQCQTNSHNIFGSQYDTSNVMKCLDNLSMWAGNNANKKGEKKKSILKNRSLIAKNSSNTKNDRSSKESKKSVCFDHSKANNQLV